MVAKGRGCERDGVGVWGEQMQTITQRMAKQQGPTVQHRELHSKTCDKPIEKNVRKECIYMHN